MIKEALQYLVDLAKDKTVEIEGQTYSTERLHHVTFPKVTPLQIETLSGLTEYILSEFDKDAFAGNLVHVASYDEVRLISTVLSDQQRETYMITDAFKPKFDFNYFYDVENFIIALQSCFVKNDDAEKILRVVGNLKDSAVKQYGDDGVSQQVTAKTGIATVEDVKVPNPVVLAPYRTFVEIEQPESEFVFRMKQGSRGPECALFEADGGTWKLEAMSRIKEYLEAELKSTGIKVIR